MKLDRNTKGKGKYALIKLREMSETDYRRMREYDKAAKGQDGFFAMQTYIPANAVDFGDTQENEFFVIRLKDKYAAAALHAYAKAVLSDGDIEYAGEIFALEKKAKQNPFKKMPD